MYFASRVQAGRQLASQISDKYKDKPCTVVALGDGGVMVGAQIAVKLHCPLTLLMSAEIKLPREPQPVAGITPGGVVAYNHSYSQGELDEMVGENYGFIESEKLIQMHALNQLVGPGGTINRDLLRDRNIIIVSDGLKSGFEIDLASQFLKPIAIEKMVVATPLASIQAVDRMHVLADELYCTSVIAEYMETDHYYDSDDVPPHDTVLSAIEHLVSNWK